MIVKNIQENMANLIAKGAAVMIILIIAALLFVRDHEWRLELRYATWPNALTMLFSLAAVLLIGIIFYKTVSSGDGEKKRFVLGVWCWAAVLFAVQAVIARQIYFYTGWDAEIVYVIAHQLATEGGSLSWYDYYYIYPNNVWLTAILMAVIRITIMMGFSENIYYACILVGCALITLAGVLTVFTVKMIIKNKWAPIIAGGIYTIMGGLSPWMVVPYSDIYGIIFPILSFYFYTKLRTQETKYPWLCWAAVFASAMAGMKIKPTAAIVLIAIVIIEGIRFVSEKKISRKALLGAAGGCAFAILLNMGINNYAAYIPDGERSITYTHYLMMGLNEETDGGYNQEDVDYTLQFADQSERQEANLYVAGERLKQMGPFGYLQFLARKTVYNFNDGTFAWEGEGEFYRQVLPEEGSLSTFLRNIYYNHYKDGRGAYYPIYQKITQILWFAILIGMLGIWKKNEAYPRKSYQAVAFLTFIGIALFVSLFEARARYLFIYLPNFIICSLLGIWNVSQWAAARKKAGKPEN